MTAKTSRWLQIFFVAVAALIGVMFFTNKEKVVNNGGTLGLQRLDLLYLNEPAPGIETFALGNSKAVIVFCEECQLPEVEDAEVVQTGDKELAKKYGMLRKDGNVGPGYAIVDTKANIRYVTYDAFLSDHSREINRLVKGVE